jgi:hypothetical protein
LTHLLQQLGSPPIADTFVPAPHPSRKVPFWGQLRTAMSDLAPLGGSR